MRLVFPIGLLALVACSAGDEQSARMPTPPPAAQPGQATDRLEKLNRLLKWPDDAGPARDIMEDHLACLQETEYNSRARRVPRLVLVAEEVKCMQAKGWVVRRSEKG